VIVRLRPTTGADLDFVVKAESDPDTGPFIIPWPRDRHAIALGDPDISHRIAEDERHNPVGFVILSGLANPDSSFEFRRIVVVEKGKGYGRSIVRAVTALAFKKLQAHRLWLDVKVHNARARSLYKSEGFVEEGLLRECIRGPVGFESLVVMSLLHRESGERHNHGDLRSMPGNRDGIRSQES
jgi:RimJ/RimL family protein N-acetyltransferase